MKGNYWESMVKLILTDSHETIDYINGEKHYIVRKSNSFSKDIYLMHGKGLPVTKKGNGWFFGKQNTRSTNGKVYAKGRLVLTQKLNTQEILNILNQNNINAIETTINGVNFILQKSDIPDDTKHFWLAVYKITPFEYYNFISKNNDFLITKSGNEPRYRNNETLIDTRLLH